MNKSPLSDGRSIAYTVEGELTGVPLVLLHGFCEDSSLWEAILPGLSGIPVVRIDLPGFGGSDLPSSPSIEAYAEDVLAVLIELQIKRCILVGHSMGGYTALTFAARYPEYLVGFGLLHSHPFADSPERRDIRQRGIDMIRSGKKSLYVTQLFSGLFAPSFLTRRPDLVDAVTETGKQQNPQGIIAALEAMMNREDHCQTLKNSPVPTLFLFGGSDMLISPELGFKAAVMPAISVVHLLPGIGHMGMFEAPEQTIKVLLDFYRFSCKL